MAKASIQPDYGDLVEPLKAAYAKKQPLNIIAANTKAFYGGTPEGLSLDVKNNQGIIDYDPAELVIVVRAGTLLSEVEAVLANKGQMLGFEPPFSSKGATIGGAIASGLAGASRAYRGGVRDYVLGVKILNGKGEIMQFGGRVIKNVAGFDLFRPMAGAMGTLGVLLEISLRVIPANSVETSFYFEVEEQSTAISTMAIYGKTLASLSAASWHNGFIILRLSGSAIVVKRDQTILAKQHKLFEADAASWQQLSEFAHPFFQDESPQLTYAVIDVPPASMPLDLSGEQFIVWGGARRYIKTKKDIGTVRSYLHGIGGSATWLKAKDRTAYFEPLSKPMALLQQRFKRAFDPAGILNPGRLYCDS